MRYNLIKNSNEIKIMSFDIETITIGNKLIPFCICLFDGKYYKTFYKLNECVDEFLHSAKNILLKNENLKKIIIYCHNLTFDGSIILQNSKILNKLKISGNFYKGSIYNLNIKIREDKDIILKCTYRMFPNKLENAFYKLECSQKIKYEIEKINTEKINTEKEKIIYYCKNDALIVYQIVDKYLNIVNKFNIETVWLTQINSLPSLSFYLFSNNFNNYRIKTTISSNDDMLGRGAYYGGRCEIFGNPKKEELLYHFDFSGMYAQVMSEEFDYGEYSIIENINKIENDGFYFIEFCSKMEIPVLPIHSKENSKLIFPNGLGSGLYWWEEIKLFIEMGGIVNKIKYKIKFNKKEKIFKNFVDSFHNMRKENTHSNSIGKFIVNSLYGRLGMTQFLTETKIFTSIDKFKKWKKKNEYLIKKIIHINYLTIVEYENSKIDNFVKSNVFLAAMITSKARVKLFNGFNSVIKEEGRVLYCDTDSIFAAFKKNMDNKKIDEIFFDISKKDTKIKKAIFALPKAYSIIYENNLSITKIKGINNVNISFEEFEDLLKNKKSKEVLIGILKKSNFIVSQESLNKLIFLNKYDKRVFNNDFTETTPIEINIKTK